MANRKGMKMIFAIPIKNHPSNLDPTARLVSGPREEYSIFSVRGGFVACVGANMALEGLFPSEAAARTAIIDYVKR